MQLASGYSHFMDLGRVLAQYDAEVRARPKARSYFEVERTGRVIRLTGHFNFICWWDFAPGGAREAVASQATYFRSRGEELIWRVYEHDKPAELGDCLAEVGFEAEPPGTLMIFDLANQLTAPIGPDIEIRRVTTMEDLQGFMAASDVAFGREESWRFAAYSSCLGDPDLALYVALVSGKTVASARLELGSSNFGLLFGGGVSPSYRRQGLYRALVAERAKEAKRWGCSYLIADARETSRPILQNLGFIGAAGETTWVLRPA
jgi:GNAT superfamily N-acetyltransferase